MKIISNANEAVLRILQNIRKTDSVSRRLRYCVETPTEDGVLLFNMLTRELVMLTDDEYTHIAEQEYLKTHWFLVPENVNEKEYADLVKWVLINRKKKSKNITGYTIFTTTDCNARCFYCFELGRSRITMNTETAHKVVEYIKTHCGGEKVSLSWFGGEPLFNKEVIDIICEGLNKAGIMFKSFAVSNGYLFDEATVKNSVELWKLERVQITLDGTEKIYNKAKAFIYHEGNPYQIVMANIERLLDASVIVQIRLNIDLYNAEDLLELVEEMAQRFGKRTGLYVYAHHLFSGDEPMAKLHTDEEWEKRDAAMCRLEEAIEKNGFASKRGIPKNIKLNHCMADSGNAVTIMPAGDIGLCEHYSESEFIGHIDSEKIDDAMVSSWREQTLEIPECAECFYYPVCLQLKKCANDNLCFRQLREERLRKTKREMLNEYLQWKHQETAEETDVEIC